MAAGRAVRRATIVVAVVAAISAAAFFPYAGRFLAVDDPLEPADVIFVLAGARIERWLEGVELYREGRASKILLSPGRADPAEEELRRRGVVLPADVELTRTAVLQLGVPPDAVIAPLVGVDNTAQEAALARRLALEAGWRRIIVVTSKYHARRTRFAFAREFRDTSIVTSVRTSRYDRSTPARWWRHRADIRSVTSELEKLLLYRLGLGE